MKNSGLEILARGLVVRRSDNGPVALLCRSIAGRYTFLPGGRVEIDESATTALDREFREELPLGCRAGALALVMEGRFNQKGRRRHEYNLVFHVEHLEGEDENAPACDRPPIAVESAETGIAFEWVALDMLTNAGLRPVRLVEWLSGEHESGADWLPS